MYAESRKKISASGEVKKSSLELSQSFDSSGRFWSEAAIEQIAGDKKKPKQALFSDLINYGLNSGKANVV